MIAQEDLAKLKETSHVNTQNDLAGDLASKYVLAKLIKHYSIQAKGDPLTNKKKYRVDMWRYVCGISPIITKHILMFLGVGVFFFQLFPYLDSLPINQEFVKMLYSLILLAFSIFCLMKVLDPKGEELLTRRKWSRFKKSEYFRRANHFFNDFNIDLMSDLKGNLAKVVDFMIWSDKFVQSHPGGKSVSGKFNFVISKYHDLVYTSGLLQKEKTLTNEIISQDLLFVLDSILSLTKSDFEAGGAYFVMAKDYFKHHDIEESRKRVKEGLSPEKYAMQSNNRLLELIGKNDI